jgi:hypothetical protein
VRDQAPVARLPKLDRRHDRAEGGMVGRSGSGRRVRPCSRCWRAYSAAMRIPLTRVLIYVLALAVAFVVAAAIGAYRWTEANCGAPSFAGECSGAPIQGVFWGLFADGGIVVIVVLVEAHFQRSSKADRRGR